MCFFCFNCCSWSDFMFLFSIFLQNCCLCYTCFGFPSPQKSLPICQFLLLFLFVEFLFNLLFSFILILVVVLHKVLNAQCNVMWCENLSYCVNEWYSIMCAFGVVDKFVSHSNLIVNLISAFVLLYPPKIIVKTSREKKKHIIPSSDIPFTSSLTAAIVSNIPINIFKLKMIPSKHWYDAHYHKGDVKFSTMREKILLSILYWFWNGLSFFFSNCLLLLCFTT